MLVLALALVTPPALAAPPPNWTVVVNGTVSSGAASNKQGIAGAKVTIYQVQAGHTRTLASGFANQDGRFKLSLNLNNKDGVLYAVAHKGSKVELMTILGTTIPATVAINEMTTVASAYAMARILQNGAIPDDPLLPVQVAAGMAENLVSAATGLPSTVMMTSPNANETNAWRSLGTLANILAACVRTPSGPACDKLFALTNAPKAPKPTTTLQAMVSIARHPAANLRPLFALGEAVKVYEPYLLAAKHGPDAPNKFMRLDAFTLAIKFNATGRVDGNGDELCTFGGLGNVAFDTNGYAWITNNVMQGTPDSSNCMIVLKPDGHPSDGSHKTPNSPIIGGGILGQGFGVGFDPSGNVWSGNFGWGGVNPTDVNGDPGGSVSQITRTGEPLSPPYGYTSSLYRVQGTVSDKHGNIWMASSGNDRVQIFPKGNPYTSFPFYQDANTFPFDIRIDSDGAGWISYNGTSMVSKFILTETGLQLQFTVPIGTGANSKGMAVDVSAAAHITAGPKGVAVDTMGNGWVANGADNSIYAVDKNGNLLGQFSGGGIGGPWGISLDSGGTVWVANFGPLGKSDQKYGISQLCGAISANCPAGLNLGDPITPDTGYTLPSAGDEVLLHDGNPLYYPLTIKSHSPLMRLTSVNVDAAGNVWCTNNWKPSWAIDVTKNPGGDGMVIFVGLAAPVMPVLYSAPPKSPFSAP
jgi:hypothetical protein